MGQVQSRAQSRTSHAKRTERSDQRMLEAAIQLIVEHGPEKTTLKEVGELAGYSRGLAGYRFGSKRGLFEFVVRSVGEHWLKQLTSATCDKFGFDAIEAAINAHYEICVNDDISLRAFYMLWFSSIESESDARNIVLSIVQRRQRDVATWLRQHKSSASINADEIAAFFSATITGIAYHWLIHPEDLSTIEAMHNQLISVMSYHLQDRTRSLS